MEEHDLEALAEALDGEGCGALAQDDALEPLLMLVGCYGVGQVLTLLRVYCEHQAALCDDEESADSGRAWHRSAEALRGAHAGVKAAWAPVLAPFTASR